MKLFNLNNRLRGNTTLKIKRLHFLSAFVIMRISAAIHSFANSENYREAKNFLQPNIGTVFIRRTLRDKTSKASFVPFWVFEHFAGV